MVRSPSSANACRWVRTFCGAGRIRRPVGSSGAIPGADLRADLGSRHRQRCPRPLRGGDVEPVGRGVDLAAGARHRDPAVGVEVAGAQRGDHHGLGAAAGVRAVDLVAAHAGGPVLDPRGAHHRPVAALGLLLTEPARLGLDERQGRQPGRGDQAHRVAVLAQRELPAGPGTPVDEPRVGRVGEVDVEQDGAAGDLGAGTDGVLEHGTGRAAADQQRVVADQQQPLGVGVRRELPGAELACTRAGDVGDHQAPTLLEPDDEATVGLGDVGLVDARLLDVGPGGAVGHRVGGTRADRLAGGGSVGDQGHRPTAPSPRADLLEAAPDVPGAQRVAVGEAGQPRRRRRRRHGIDQHHGGRGAEHAGRDQAGEGQR